MSINDGANGILCGTTESPLQQLRKRIAPLLTKYPSYDTQFSLERWLQAYSYSIDETCQKIKWALKTIAAMDAHRTYKDGYELNDHLRMLNPSADYFPGGVMGTDKSGNVLLVQAIGRSKPGTLMRLGRVSDLYRAAIVESEACMSFLRKEEAARQRKLGIILIFDLDELCLQTIFTPAVKAYFSVLATLQLIFPNSIKKVFVINAPAAVNSLFIMAKKVLSKKLIENIEFLDGSWKDILKAEIGKENIYSHWGGCKVDGTSSTGAIRMCGDVPIEIQRKILVTIPHPPEDRCERLMISPGKTAHVSVFVSNSSSSLNWYFKVNKGEVDFWITFGNSEIWPRFNLSTEYVPEYGSVNCSTSGTYVLHFESSAKFFNKEILYLLSVK